MCRLRNLLLFTVCCVRWQLASNVINGDARLRLCDFSFTLLLRVQSSTNIHRTAKGGPTSIEAFN